MECFYDHFPMEKKVYQGRSFYRCPHCAFLRKEQILSPKEQKNRYDYHQVDENYLKYMNGIVQKIRPLLVGKKILDFGCGKLPALANLLKQEGYETFYYDLFYFPKKIQEQMDTIVMIEVFEHLEDPWETLKTCIGQLNPHGKILIKTQPYEKDNLDSWWYLRDDTHLNFVLPSTLRQWCSQLGLDFHQADEDIFVLRRIS